MSSSVPSFDKPSAGDKMKEGTLRRGIDVAVALVLGVGFMPILAVIGIVIWLTMGSPIFFTQRRAGLGGASVCLLKFRSMTDARDGEGRLLPDTERITPLGWFLRRFRIDELPGLLNVLRGDLSLIGPRPLLPETVDGFGEAGRRRGRVRPGLTGWAQINGNTRLSDGDKLALDLWYIDNRSPALDLTILLATLAVLLHGERLNPANIEAARSHARRRYRLS